MPSERVDFKTVGQLRCPYCNNTINLGVVKGRGTPSMVHEGIGCERFNNTDFEQTVADALKATEIKRTN